MALARGTQVFCRRPPTCEMAQLLKALTAA
jgi:hypothetical protein